MIVTVTLNPGVDRTLTVEELRFNEVLRAKKVQLDWGGKGLNVARTLKILGEESLATGLIGGASGEMLRKGLNSLGVANDFFEIKHESRSNYVILDEKNQRHIKVNEPGPVVDEGELAAFVEWVSQTAQEGDYWVFCGSLPPGVPTRTYAELIKAVKVRGARACLDSSGEALRLGIEAQPYLVKPNREELEGLTGRKLNSIEEVFSAAVELQQKGVEIVLVSMGAKGLIVAAKDIQELIPAPNIEEKNPTGAGDALLAGFILAVKQGFAIERAARLAVAAGSAAASTAGVGIDSRTDVESLYRRIAPQQRLPILPPYLMTSEPGSFAESTIVERKPKIIQGVIEDNEYPPQIVASLREFAEEIAHKPIQPLRENAPDTVLWNQHCKLYKGYLWTELPWYFAETFFYRRLLECVGYFQEGAQYGKDVFAKAKQRQIEADVQRLAELWQQFENLDENHAFEALLHSCLWGNRTDLSNFTVQVKAHESQGAAAAREKANILIDHTDEVKAFLSRGVQQVHFICDNAGTDTLFDLVLTDYLLQQGWVKQVVMHLKDRSFFVSDAMLEDMHYTLQTLKKQPLPALQAFVQRLYGYINVGMLCWHTHSFWTSCLMYRELPRDLVNELSRADLVILKGDVNYRRILDDRHWDYSTPIEEAAGYFPANFLLLRTLKGEIMVGLKPGEAEAIEAQDPTWLINGKRGVIHLHIKG